MSDEKFYFFNIPKYLIDFFPTYSNYTLVPTKLQRKLYNSSNRALKLLNENILLVWINEFCA